MHSSSLLVCELPAATDIELMGAADFQTLRRVVFTLCSQKCVCGYSWFNKHQTYVLVGLLTDQVHYNQHNISAAMNTTLFKSSHFSCEVLLSIFKSVPPSINYRP